MALQGAMVTGANAALALVIFWMGLSVLLRPHLGGSSPDLHEVIPRLVLSAELANSAAHWTALAIDTNDMICARLRAVDSGTLGAPLRRVPVLYHTWLIALLLVALLLVPS